MNLMAGLFAGAAAVIGMIIWAVITNVTGYQIGWMAVGMGALIGAGTRFGGGEGKVAALFSGGLAVVAMFAGNLIATQIVIDKYIKEEAAAALTQEMYNDTMVAADQFVTTTEDQYPQFIIEHTYISEATSPAQVTAAEIQEFKEYSVPELRQLHTERPDFKTWRNREYAYAKAAIKSEINMIQVVFENLGVLGFVFMLMGMVAAVRVVGEWE